MNYNDDGYRMLAAAIVEQAVADYRKALRRLRKHPEDDSARYRKEECERFFRERMNRYVDADLDGEAVIRAIRDRVDKETRR